MRGMFKDEGGCRCYKFDCGMRLWICIYLGIQVTSKCAWNGRDDVFVYIMRERYVAHHMIRLPLPFWS